MNIKNIISYNVQNQSIYKLIVMYKDPTQLIIALKQN